MKKLLTLCLLVTLVWAAGRSKSFIDDGGSSSEPHLPAVVFDGAAVLVDSSVNGYTAWTQAHECLSYDATNDGLEFVCRGRFVGGTLNVHQTDGAFSFWTHEVAVYNQEYGGARYPSACATDGPHICAPFLIGGAWGGMMGQYEEGGWWSEYWALPEDIGPGNLGTHKVIGKQLANGNMLFVGYTTGEILYRTWSQDLLTPIATGTVATGYNYWGFDYNGGIGYMFYYDDDLNVFYRSTTDGVTWTPEQQYNMVWPNPYTNNLLFWTQLAVTDAGDPILVFDFLNYDDYTTGTYPYLGKIYISRQEGQACVEVSSGYTRNFYPTVASDGNYVIVLYHSAQATTGIDSLCFWDIHAAVSSNLGASFRPAINLTGSLTSRPGLAQISKRLDAATGNFFYFYGINAVRNHDPIWTVWRGSGGLELAAHRWYVGRYETGVQEYKTAIPSRTMVNVGQNPVSRQTSISYTVSVKGDVSLNLYDRAGRMVRSIESGYRNAGAYSANFRVDDLASGTYFVVLNTAAAGASAPLVVVR